MTASKTNLTADEIELRKDPESEDLCPSLSDDELRPLKTNIENDGAFLETIKVWAEGGHYIVIDGHHRYEIWRSLPKDTTISPPPVKLMELADRDEAKNWIIHHQLGRRNLSRAVLRVLRQETNTLSAIIRQAWDGGPLRTLTKNSPAKATNAHISIIGHITKNELCRYLSETEAGNGFGNRFLWL